MMTHAGPGNPSWHHLQLEICQATDYDPFRWELHRHYEVVLFRLFHVPYLAPSLLLSPAFPSPGHTPATTLSSLICGHWLENSLRRTSHSGTGWPPAGRRLLHYRRRATFLGCRALVLYPTHWTMSRDPSHHHPQQIYHSFCFFCFPPSGVRTGQFSALPCEIASWHDDATSEVAISTEFRLLLLVSLLPTARVRQSSPCYMAQIRSHKSTPFAQERQNPGRPWAL
jgi:hypothetical protein